MKKVTFIALFLLLVVSINLSSTYAWKKDPEYTPPTSDSRYYIHTSFPTSQYSAVTSAASAWNSAGSKFKLSCESVLDSSTLKWGDTKMHVAYVPFSYYGWDPDGNGAFAYTATKVYGDVLLNSSKSWGNGSSSNYLDYQGILTHEFGHSTGLDDVYGQGDVVGDPSKYNLVTMYGYSSYSMQNSWGMRTLEYDDITGIKALWP
ncbi:MAG: hypothetical protein N3B21_18815 [Clostridia bacterium]|nr:hypothetical protein [Clostridia bacterium]